MSRLDDIRKRDKQYSVSIVRYVHYEDLAWMINRIERYEKALNEIAHKGKFIDTVEECCYIAEEALKDETK